MHLDLALLVFLLACFGAGLLRGLLDQCVVLSALLSGAAAAWLAAVLLPPMAGGHPGATALACACVFLAVYCVERRLLRRQAGRLATSFRGGRADRILGGALAVLEGIAAALLLLWLCDAVGGRGWRENPRVKRVLDASGAARFALRHNPLPSLTAVRRCNGFLAALRDPDARARLREQPAYEAVVSNPSYRAVRDSRSLAAAARGKGPPGALLDPRVRNLLIDASFWRSSLAVRWEAAGKTPAEEIADGGPPAGQARRLHP